MWCMSMFTGNRCPSQLKHDSFQCKSLVNLQQGAVETATVPPNSGGRCQTTFLQPGFCSALGLFHMDYTQLTTLMSQQANHLQRLCWNIYLCISDPIQNIYWINFAKAIDCSIVSPPWSEPACRNQRLWYQMIPSSPSASVLSSKLSSAPISLPPGEALTSSEGELQRPEWWEWRFSLPFPPQLPLAASSPNGGQKGDWRYWEQSACVRACVRANVCFRHPNASLSQTRGRNMHRKLNCVWLNIYENSFAARV